MRTTPVLRRRTALTVVAVLSAVSLVLGIAACGSSDSSTSTGTSTETPPPAAHGGASALTKYLPADAVVIRTVDIKAAAHELGVPRDADPFVVPDEQTDLNDSSVKFSLVVAAGFGPYEQEFGLGRPNPVAAAFDGSAITEGASTLLDSDHPASAIRTSQPFAEIAKTLEKSGFKRDGDTLQAIKPTRTQYSSVASAGHGVIVIAGAKANAADLVSSPPGGPTSLEQLIAPADKPIAVAATEPSDQCVGAFGGWNDTSGSGMMRFTVDGGANSDAIDLGALDSTSIDPGTPEVKGDVVEIPFTKKQGSQPPNSASPLQDLIIRVPIGKLYTCPSG